MKTFEKYHNKEDIFISLSHLDELKPKFDFIIYPNNLFYFYDNKCLFNNYKKKNFFNYNYDIIGKVIEHEYKLNQEKTHNKLKNIIKKHFQLNNIFTISIFTNLYMNMIINHFKFNI